MGIFLLILAFSSQASCLTDADCSGHGVCNVDRSRCICHSFWTNADCATPLSSLTKTPLYGVYRWAGVIWYATMTLILARSIRRVRQRKSLKFICLSYRPQWDRGGGSEADPQQLTLTFVFGHCFFSLIEYAIDPGALMYHSSASYIFILNYIDLLFIMCGVFTMVRFWVKLRASFSQITTKVLRVFEITSISLLSISLFFAFLASITQVSSSSVPVSSFSIFLFLGFGLAYFIFVLGFALYYGVELLRYLQERRSTTQLSTRPLRKLTVLMLTMMVAVALGVITIVTGAILAYTYTVNIIIPVNMGVRFCIGLFVITVPFALGDGVQSQPSPVTSHGSKRFVDPTKKSMAKPFVIADDTRADSGNEEIGESAKQSGSDTRGVVEIQITAPVDRFRAKDPSPSGGQ